MSNAYLVIIAGGSGTRFWPKSTARRPKQLLSFSQDEGATLLRQTLSRFEGITRPENRLIVTTALLKSPIETQAAGNLSARVLAEPQGRNTSPCVYWAAREIAARDPKGVMLVMPADHHIPDVAAFQRALHAAIRWATEHEDLVTLGIRPTRPETGYGYLRTGAARGDGCLKVDAFVEKPNLEKAQQFIKEGNYLWNGGMFVWKAETILKAFDRHMPEMAKAWDASGGNVELAYPKLTATSIDYGVMERADNVVTFPLDCGWDDLGSWTSLESIADQLGIRHEAGVLLAGELLGIESRGNIVNAPEKWVALLGVNDLIVVSEGKTLMIAPKSRAQDIKLLVEETKKRRPELV